MGAEMNFDFNEIKMDTVVKTAEKEAAVRTSVSESESGVVTKILDVSADGKIISLDNQNGAARVFGRVNFKVLYLNGDGETRGLDYFADFTEVIQNDSLSGRLYAQIAVIDVDTSISGGIRLNAVVKITLYRVAENDKKCLVGADDDVYVENTAMKCQRFITSMSAPFTVTDEYDTKTDVTKILLTRAGTYVDAATAGMGNVLLSGASDVTVTYLANDKVYVKDFHIPYSEEFAVDGVEIGQKLSAEVVVKNARVVIAGIEGSNVIRVEVENEACVKAYDVTDEKIVKDVFCIENEINITRASVSTGVYGGFAFFKDELSGIAALSNDLPAVLEVIGVTSAGNGIAKATAENGKIVIEGVFSANVLYRDENGLSSVSLEVPYSLPFLSENANATDDVSARGAVIKAQAKLKREREIEVTAELGFMTESVKRVDAEYIAEAEVGEKIEVNKSAVSVFVADEGDTLWDAAKALSARPDDIQSQNPDARAPFKEGQKLFYFREISFEF